MSEGPKAQKCGLATGRLIMEMTTHGNDGPKAVQMSTKKRMLIAGIVAMCVIAGTAVLIPLFVPGTPLDKVYAMAVDSLPISLTKAEIERGKHLRQQKIEFVSMQKDAQMSITASDWWEAQGYHLKDLQSIREQLSWV